MEKARTLARASSSKISKGRERKNKRLGTISDSLIKSLRPRVYITEASDFKRLVQELTGNGGLSPQQQIPSGSHPPPRACPPTHNGTSSITVNSSDGVVTSSGSETQSWDDFAGILEEWDAVAVHFTEEVPPSVPSCHPEQIQVHRQESDNDDTLTTFGDIEGWLMDIDFAVPSLGEYGAMDVYASAILTWDM